MSLFDNLSSLANSMLGGSIQDSLPGLLNKALGQTEMGDLNGLLAKLNEGGLGQHVQSWLGSGSNIPVSPEQISSALSGSQIGQMAASVGLDDETVRNALASYLPGLVDKLSPNGVLETPAS